MFLITVCYFRLCYTGKDIETIDETHYEQRLAQIDKDIADLNEQMNNINDQSIQYYFCEQQQLREKIQHLIDEHEKYSKCLFDKSRKITKVYNNMIKESGRLREAEYNVKQKMIEKGCHNVADLVFEYDTISDMIKEFDDELEVYRVFKTAIHYTIDIVCNEIETEMDMIRAKMIEREKELEEASKESEALLKKKVALENEKSMIKRAYERRYMLALAAADALCDVGVPRQ